MSDSEIERALGIVAGIAPPAAAPAAPAAAAGRAAAPAAAATAHVRLAEKVGSELLGTSTGTSAVGARNYGYKTTAVGVNRASWSSHPRSVRRANLADTALMASGAKLSERSVPCAQLVSADCIREETKKVIGDVVNGIQSENTVVVKRVWDEATLYFGMPYNVLNDFVGKDQAEIMREIADARQANIKDEQLARCKGKAFSMDVFQQSCSIRWGKEPQQIEHIISPSRLLPSKSTSCLLSAVHDSIPEIHEKVFKQIGDKAKLIFFILFP